MNLFKYFVHILAVGVLTILTQLGGIVWIVNFGFFSISKSKKSRSYRLLSFGTIYVMMSFLVFPQLAKLNDRVALPISKSGNLIPHTWITPLLNRHYVNPILKSELMIIAKEMNGQNPDLKVSYLDANFPFVDGFPLLPHLSHNDGKKIDIAFFYRLNNQKGNKKPSISGYGKFVKSVVSETNQTLICKSRGHWQYDITKYLTLGERSDMQFDESATRDLIQRIVQRKATQKLFIEPHLKQRMRLSNPKIRFHGCQAVRHDDHIHYQIQ